MAFFGAIYNGASVNHTMTGTLTVGKILLTDAGSTSAPQVALATDTDSGLFLAGGNSVSLVGGTARGFTAGAFGAAITDVPLIVPLGLTLSGDTTPAALASGSNDNLNLGTLSNFTTYRLTPDAAGSTITGIAGGADGGTIYLHNIHASVVITLNHDATSTAANRFLCPGSANVTIPANGTRMLRYDATSSRWRVF